MSRQKVAGPFVWMGDDMAKRDDWIIRLAPEMLEEIDRAVTSVRRRGVTLDDVTRDDFPLPHLSGRLADVVDELANGRGFVQIKGLEIEKYSDEEAGIIFWGLGAHMGIGVSQSFRGDRLGHVIASDQSGMRQSRSYRLSGPLDMHTDPADMVGLLCLRMARSGGESRIASAMQVHNALLDEHPEHLEALYAGYHYRRPDIDRGDEEPLTPYKVPLYGACGDGTACFYIPRAVEAAVDIEKVKLSEVEAEALRYFAETATRPGIYLDMNLEPGDMQFLNNRVILHGRTDYVDFEKTAEKRHLLRIWLMRSDWPRLLDTMRVQNNTDLSGGGIPQGKAPADIINADTRF